VIATKITDISTSFPPGVNLGPNLVESVKKLQGRKLLQQMIEPSSEIHPQYQSWQFELSDGRVINGVIAKEDSLSYQVLTNLLASNAVTVIRKSEVDDKRASKVSAMPVGLLNILTRDEILDLAAFLEAGGKVPGHDHAH
jgi:putative heme-binding domain-containing protein